MNRKKVFNAVLTIALCAAMTAPAQAATNPLAAMEIQSQQAVAAAIRAGTVPLDTTIYDCMYGADKNGVAIVIEYRNKNGDLIDTQTQKKKEAPPDNSKEIEAMSRWLDGLTLTPSADTPAGFERLNKSRGAVQIQQALYEVETLGRRAFSYFRGMLRSDEEKAVCQIHKGHRQDADDRHDGV